jgi:hypothetical protein
MAQFFYRIDGYTQPVRYRVEIYENSSADLSVTDMEKRFETRFVYEYEFFVSAADVD